MQKPLDVKGIRFGEGRPVICVPVVERERAGVVNKIRSLAERNIQMIEWRVDCFQNHDCPEEVRDILSEIAPFTGRTVMLFTLRTKAQGGGAHLPENDILCLDEIAAKSGSIDFVDIEYFELSQPEREIRRLRRMGVHVISSHHDFDKTPDDALLRLTMDQLQKSGGDMAKLAVMPHSADDVLRLLQLTNDTVKKYPDLPVITIAMGDMGVVSRVAGETFGSCVTFGADGEGSAPGQLKADTLSGILDALHESGNAGRHIFLIGFMGVGKSAVSAELKDMLGMRTVELDDAIARDAGMTIAQMFEEFGEEYFRDRETDMLLRIAGSEPAVVSCGGGCVLREENVAAMKRCGTVVLLTAGPQTIYDRVKDDTDRPVLNGHMDPAFIGSLMEKRKPAYEAAGDVRISTDGRTPSQIAREIADML